MPYLGPLWTCTDCRRAFPCRIHPVLRGPFATLGQMSLGALGQWRALCPHYAERPPGPDEVEVGYRVLREDASGMDVMVDVSLDGPPRD